MDPLTLGIAGLAGFALYDLARKPKVTSPVDNPPSKQTSTTDLGGGLGGAETIGGIVQPKNQEQQTDNQLLNTGIKDAGSLARGNYVGAVFDYVKIASGQSLQIREGANSYLGKTGVTDNIVQPVTLAAAGALAALVAAPYAVPIAAFAFAIIDASQIIEEKIRNAQYDALKKQRDAYIQSRNYKDAMDVVKSANEQGFGSGWGFNIVYVPVAPLVSDSTEAISTLDMIGYAGGGPVSAYTPTVLSPRVPYKLTDNTGKTYDPDTLLSEAVSPLIVWYNNFKSANNRRPTRSELNAAGQNVFTAIDWIGFHFPWTLTLKNAAGDDSKSGIPITSGGVDSKSFTNSDGSLNQNVLTTSLKDFYRLPVIEDETGITTQQQVANRQAARQEQGNQGTAGGKTQNTNSRTGGGY